MSTECPLDYPENFFYSYQESLSRLFNNAETAEDAESAEIKNSFVKFFGAKFDKTKTLKHGDSFSPRTPRFSLIQ